SVCTYYICKYLISAQRLFVLDFLYSILSVFLGTPSLVVSLQNLYMVYLILLILFQPCLFCLYLIICKILFHYSLNYHSNLSLLLVVFYSNLLGYCLRLR